MTSRSYGRTAAPWWVALDTSLRGAGPAPRLLAPGPMEPGPAPAIRSDGPSFERAARRRPDVRVAVALVTLWVILWIVFAAGVVVPAAAVHAEREGQASAALARGAAERR
jgi:hypothetical protein